MVRVQITGTLLSSLLSFRIGWAWEGQSLPGRSGFLMSDHNIQKVTDMLHAARQSSAGDLVML